MVEIIKDARELRKNITIALNSDNEYLTNEYNRYRKKLVKVLRVIYLFRKEDNNKDYDTKLKKLKAEAKNNMRQSSTSIDKLIRKNLITAEMASSMFNDYANVNDMTKKLIDVAELLYHKKDPLFDNGQ